MVLILNIIIIRLTQELIHRYHIAMSPPMTLLMISKQKLLAASSHLSGYTKCSNFYHHNKLFKANRTQLYQQFCNSQMKCFPSPPQQETLQFWKRIWDPDIPLFQQPVWFNDSKRANQPIPLQQFSISLEDLQCTVKQIKNWSAPGFDKIHGFWLNKLTAIHLLLTELYKKAIYEPPTCLVQGLTHLFIKSHSKCESAYDVSNYVHTKYLSFKYLEITNKNCWELNLFTF